jgi:putative transposase
MVDSLGLIWALMVRPADVQDRDGGRWLVEMIRGKWATLREVIVDSGFSAKFGDRVTTRCGWTVTTTRGLAGRFAIHPRRWVVERTFGWLVRYRRLTVDREDEVGVSEAMIRVAMIHLMARRLEPPR